MNAKFIKIQNLSHIENNLELKQLGLKYISHQRSPAPGLGGSSDLITQDLVDEIRTSLFHPLKQMFRKYFRSINFEHFSVASLSPRNFTPSLNLIDKLAFFSLSLSLTLFFFAHSVFSQQC